MRKGLHLRCLESRFAVRNDSNRNDSNRHRVRSDFKLDDSNRQGQKPFESLLRALLFFTFKIDFRSCDSIC